MEISFPGGLEVGARYQGFTIPTDQPARAGGRGAAPSPFDLFLASIGTCAGLYALRFCQQRELDTTGLAVTLSGERAEDDGSLSIIRLEIRAPEGFPDKYRPHREPHDQNCGRDPAEATPSGGRRLRQGVEPLLPGSVTCLNGLLTREFLENGRCGG